MLHNASENVGRAAPPLTVPSCGNSDFSFGVVSRLGTQKSTFELKLIHSNFPTSKSVAMEFLFEVQKRGIRDSGMSPHSKSLIHSWNTWLLATRNLRLKGWGGKSLRIVPINIPVAKTTPFAVEFDTTCLYAVARSGTCTSGLWAFFVRNSSLFT